MRRHVTTSPLCLTLLALALVSVACGDDSTSNSPSGAAGTGGSAGAGAAAGSSNGGSSGSSGSGQSGSSGSGNGPSTRSMFIAPSAPDQFTGCSVDGLESEVTVECFPAFWDHPWPSDARRDPDGLVRTTGYPNPLNRPLITQYVTLSDRLLDGFSPQAAGFLRFTGALDATTLPGDPLASIETSSSVQLIDIDPDSPEHGQRKLINVFWRGAEGTYWSRNMLAFQPAFGYPLRPNTRYAVVVTDSVRDESGASVGRDADLDAVLGLSDASGDAATLKTAWASAITEITNAGITPDHIVHMSVYTTNDPVGETVKIRDYIHDKVEAPTIKDVTLGSEKTRYHIYEGNFGPNPNFQRGKLPFANSGDGGSFEFDDNGEPLMNEDVPTFDMRFTLTIPKADQCPMPAAGYPIVLYAHGTGGDYKSFIYDDTADALAQHCLAGMGVDQIFHGTRPGTPMGPDAETQIQVLFFNFLNIEAARTNARQSALDEVQRARLFTESLATIPADTSVTGSTIKFDPTKVMFFGHSQGGLNGPLFLAVDDGAIGGVLSGSGSIISITLLEKTKPVDITALVSGVALGLNTKEDAAELNELHPAISLAQSIVDTVDPIHYVKHIVLEPRDGFKPKSIYQTEGVNADGSGDNYTPPHAIEVQSIACGLPLQNPGIHPLAEAAWGGPGSVAIPAEGLSGNLANGQASGVLAQWPAAQASDGHFVVFDIEAARQQASQFCRNLADDPKGKVPAPLFDV